MKAMILGAGLGTRLRPLTDRTPKVLLRVQSVPLLEHVILYLRHHGADEIIINVHHLADQIIQFLREHGNFGLRIEISDERERLMDTGGGLQKAGWFFNDGKPFIVSAGDIVTDLDLGAMMQFHLNQQALVTLAVRQRPSTRELLFDGDMRLRGWKSNVTGETRTAARVGELTPFAFSAIQVADPAIFPLMTEKGAYSLTDLYLRLAAGHRIVGFRHEGGLWYEFGRPDSFTAHEHDRELHRILRRHDG